MEISTYPTPSSSKLEIHYYLKNQQHIMDALIHNKCEAELLAIAHEVISILDFDLNIQVEALKEGGLKDIWKWIGDNDKQIKVVLQLIGILLAVSTLIQTQSEFLEMQDDIARLTIEEKKLNIQKLKRELAEDKVKEETLETAAKTINNSHKVTIRKSNFYKNLTKYSDVEKVGFLTLDKNNTPTAEEVIISKQRFYEFVAKTDKLKPELDNSAAIRIISPVLTLKNARWRGEYLGEEITFWMNHREFKRKVASKEIRFANGDTILCKLQISSKLNEYGEVYNAEYKVMEVYDMTNDSIYQAKSPMPKSGLSPAPVRDLFD